MFRNGKRGYRVSFVFFFPKYFWSLVFCCAALFSCFDLTDLTSPMVITVVHFKKLFFYMLNLKVTWNLSLKWNLSNLSLVPGRLLRHLWAVRYESQKSFIGSHVIFSRFSIGLVVGWTSSHWLVSLGKFREHLAFTVCTFRLFFGMELNLRAKLQGQF